MKHSDIQGWCDFENGYREAVAYFNSGIFVEVGTFLGRSLCYLANEVKLSRKPIRVVGIDTFRGTGPENGNDNHRDAVNRGNGTFCGETHANLIKCGVADVVDLIVANSVRASSYFADLSVDFIFLDAAHDEINVSADIAAWLPKVRNGGWIAGDDLCPVWPGIEKAVKSSLPSYSRWSHDSWIYRKPS